jgi:DNA (cytosine-5)-methyltransferase 1
MMQRGSILKLGSLFDGIGGFPLVASRHGIEPVWASEIEPFPIKVTQQHFPNMKHLGDITKINGTEIEPVDVITFGSPCQDLSVAGKREGLSGERSGLFMDAVRIIREMRRASGGEYPRFIVWENVPGAFSSNKGEDFRAVLEEIAETEIPMPRSGKWANAGMVRTERIDIAWRTLDAQYWGVPQRRKRIFLVADFGGQCAGEILFESEGLRRDTAESGEAREEVATDAERGTDTPIWDIGDRRRIIESENVAPTLLSKMGTGGNNVPIVPATPKTMLIRCGKDGGGKGALIQDDKSATLSTLNIQTLFQPVAIENHPADSRVKLDESGTVQTLTTRMGTGGGNVPMLAVPDTKVFGICSYASNSMKSSNPHSGIYEAKTSRTLDLNGGSPACNQGGMAIVQCIEPGALSRGQGERVWDKCPTLRANMGDNQPCVVFNEETITSKTNASNPKPGDPCHTLGATGAGRTIVLNDQGGSQMSVSSDVVGTLRAEMHGNIPAVTTHSFQRSDEFKETDKLHTLAQRDYKDSTDLVASTEEIPTYSAITGQQMYCWEEMANPLKARDYKDPQIVNRGYTVRRLTPLECERLQGFPDGWTDIPGQTEATQEELEFWREVWLTWDKTQAKDPEKVKPRTDKAILKWLKNPTSDSAQYKALGNSVAVPCPEYVLEGIKEVLEVANEEVMP